MLPDISVYIKLVSIIQKVAEGTTLKSACAQFSIPRVEAMRAIRSDTRLTEMLQAAQQDHQDTLSETLLKIDNDLEYGHTDPKMAKVVSENIKWYLARNNPAKFGERIKVETTHTADSVILAALNAAKARVIDVTDYKVIAEAGNNSDNLAAIRELPASPLAHTISKEHNETVMSELQKIQSLLS
jgi:hypothetical protein